MQIIAGLGNPGAKYAGNRHNIGFMALDAIHRKNPFSPWSKKFKAEISEGELAGEKVLLVKPQTFMNLSGRPVRQVTDFYQVPLENVLVVCDDINLPLGRLRFRARGTHGGHNGLRDIQNHVGTTEYPRLRIGVGAPDEKETVDHVLGRFRPSEAPVIEEALEKAVQAVDLWIRQGIQECMNRYNG